MKVVSIDVLTPRISKREKFNGVFLSKNDKFFLIVVNCVVLAALTRMFYCIMYPVPVRDTYKYIELLERWISSGKLTNGEGIPPLGLFIMKLPHDLFGYDLLQGGVIINVLLGLGIVIVLQNIAFLITDSVFAGLIVGILAATHPSLVNYSCHMTRENTFLLTASLSLYFTILLLERKSYLYIIYSSFFCTAAYLTRHEGLELLLIAVLAILLKFRNTKPRKLTALILFFIMCFCSFSLISYAMGVDLSYYKTYTRRFPEFYLIIESILQ